MRSDGTVVGSVDLNTVSESAGGTNQTRSEENTEGGMLRPDYQGTDNGEGSKFHEQISRMTVYLHNICYPRDAIVDTGASITMVGSSQIRDIPHRLLSSGKSRILGM